MTIDVVNGLNEKVGALDLSDEVFGGQVHGALIWESVVREEAGRRRGTHATRTRGRVSGTGRKPWRQKGTGRARVGEARNPLWRGGGTVFGPEPRSYAYRLPKKVVRGALRAALRQRLGDGGVIVIDEFAIESEAPRTREAAALLQRLGADAGAVLVDVHPDDRLEQSARNLPGVRVVASNRLTARDVMVAGHVIASRAAVEHLARVLER
ncbi:MAG: 50S ribosomal protein L4 [Acidobacteria bacterium]|nr:50S ribosomal protein L4 [Acidobacteriota bacterium]